MSKHNWITKGERYGESTENPNAPYLHGAEDLGSDYHNGPKCKTCGFEFCHHCNPEAYNTECGTSSMKGDESKIMFRI